jgi:serine phosphatase RsbU (regulator of sigma subunit)
MKMAKKRTSIKTEITLFIVVLMVSVIGVLSYFVLQSQKQGLTSEVKLRGQSVAKNLAGSIADFLLTEDELSIARLMSDIMNNKGVLYALVADEKGRIKASNNLEQLGEIYREPAALEEFEQGPAKIMVYQREKGERIIDFSAPVIAKGKIKLGTVRLGISYSIIDDVLKAAYIKAGIISLVSIIFGIIGAFVLGAAITKPIAVLAAGAKTIGKGNLEHKISVKSKNELGELASIFNLMTVDLKHAQENAIKQQRFEKELEVARDIQLSLIPKNIAEIQGYEINAFYKSAKEVGGDYYDVIPLNREKFGIVMGDVSGKGVPAALIMTMARSTLHSEAREAYDKPSSDTLKKLNSILAVDIREGMFVTIFYGILDIKRNIINISSAGHNDTLVYRKSSGDVLPYNPKGFPLGTDPGPRFDKVIKNEDVLLEPGDKMIIFTDGITEAMNTVNEEFGDARLIDAIKKNGGKTGKEVLDAVIGRVDEFVNGAAQSDDIAVVVLTRV